MKKFINTKTIAIILFIILLIVAYNYFNSIPIEADNTLMNDDDSIQYSITQYAPPIDASYSFINNSSDFSFNNVNLNNMGKI